MTELLREPWPWWVAGPMIGLIVPILLILGNKSFGVSSSLRHWCAACIPSNIAFFKYDWRKEGGWNLAFIAGAVIGGFLGGYILGNPEPVAISEETRQALGAIGVDNFSGLVPTDVFSWANVLTLQGVVVMIVGGFLVGFGARYAGGCTSGHAITGIANLQLASVIAVAGFFVGGLLATYFLLPIILSF